MNKGDSPIAQAASIVLPSAPPPHPSPPPSPHQGPSIPSSTSSSATLLTSPSNTDAYPNPPSPLPPRQCCLHRLVLYEKWKGTKQNKKVSLIFRILKTAISVSPDTFAAAYPAAPLPLRPPSDCNASRSTQASGGAASSFGGGPKRAALTPMLAAGRGRRGGTTTTIS